MTFLVVDFSDKAFEKARPIIYNAAFNKERFAILDIVELYQEVFDRVPLSLIQYEWVLASVNSSRLYALLKRSVDIIGSIVLGLLSLIVYPFVALAIKLEDGGPIFISQKRVGRYQRNTARKSPTMMRATCFLRASPDGRRSSTTGTRITELTSRKLKPNSHTTCIILNTARFCSIYLLSFKQYASC